MFDLFGGDRPIGIVDNGDGTGSLSVKEVVNPDHDPALDTHVDLGDGRKLKLVSNGDGTYSIAVAMQTLGD